MQPTKAPWHSSNPAATKPDIQSGMAEAALGAHQPATGAVSRGMAATSRPCPVGMLGGASARGMGMGILSRNDQSAIQVEPKMPEVIEPVDEAVAPSSSSEEYHVSSRWRPAAKRITTPEELKLFQSSTTFRSFLSFVMFLNQSVDGKKASAPCESSESIQNLRKILACLANWIDE